MELSLRSTITPELSHVLLSLFRITDPRRMNIRLEEIRIPSFSFDDVNLTVSRE